MAGGEEEEEEDALPDNPDPSGPYRATVETSDEYIICGAILELPDAEAERALRDRAMAEAADLFAHHGDAASAMLTAKINDPAATATERRLHRLARVEVERRARQRRNAPNPRALAILQRPRFSLLGLLGLFWRGGGAQPRGW